MVKESIFLENKGCPTLIIARYDDNTVGNDAPHEFNKLISNSKIHIYEGLGYGLLRSLRISMTEYLNSMRTNIKEE